MSFERENIRKMSGYASGEQPEDESTLKLNTNENPYPPSPQVSRVLATFKAESLRRYPPATAARFRGLAAELHHVSPDNVIATRGGDELLRLVITTFVDPGECIGVTQPTYSLYPVLAQIQNCPIVEVPLLDNWALPENFAEQMNQSNVKLTLLVNPHAPTGILLNYDRISRLASELDSILLLDEAYIDFVDGPYPTTELINEHDNLIILRTLSKGYSLAGLRFGYGIAAAPLIDPMMSKTRDSYNLDHISQLIAEAAILDQAHAKKSWLQVIDERRRLQKAMLSLGLPSPPSQANFLLVTVPASCGVSAVDIYQKLKEKHILVRHFADPRLDDKLRISIGTIEENDQLLSTLEQILA